MFQKSTFYEFLWSCFRDIWFQNFDNIQCFYAIFAIFKSFITPNMWIPLKKDYYCTEESVEMHFLFSIGFHLEPSKKFFEHFRIIITLLKSNLHIYRKIINSFWVSNLRNLNLESIILLRWSGIVIAISLLRSSGLGPWTSTTFRRCCLSHSSFMNKMGSKSCFLHVHEHFRLCWRWYYILITISEHKNFKLLQSYMRKWIIQGHETTFRKLGIIINPNWDTKNGI